MDPSRERKARHGRKSCEMPSYWYRWRVRASLTHISASSLARFVVEPSLKDRSSSSSSSTQHDAFMLLFARCCLVYVILHPSSLCLFHSRCNCCAGEKQVFQPGLLFLSLQVGWDAIRISFLRLPSWSILFCSFITLRVFCENGIRCVFLCINLRFNKNTSRRLPHCAALQAAQAAIYANFTADCSAETHYSWF